MSADATPRERLLSQLAEVREQIDAATHAVADLDEQADIYRGHVRRLQANAEGLRLAVLAVDDVIEGATA